MTRKVKLHDVAHARAGDKGNISSINLWIREPRFYSQVKAQLTAERVKEAYPELFHGRVERYEIEHLHGLTFVIHEALEGGVKTSLNLDAHGKSWSFLILDIELELDETAQSSDPQQ